MQPKFLNKDILILIFLIFIGVSKADPYDSSGLIDLKNEGTRRRTCIDAAYWLEISASNISLSPKYNNYCLRTPEIISPKTDKEWVKSRKCNDFYDFVSNAKMYSKILEREANKYVPPSEWRDFKALVIPTGPHGTEGAATKNPIAVFEAWYFCAAGYGFVK